MAFDGMQSQRCAAPPTMSRSINVTSAPSRAACVAALLPAGPPPMIAMLVTRSRLPALQYARTDGCASGSVHFGGTVARDRRRAEDAQSALPRASVAHRTLA